MTDIVLMKASGGLLVPADQKSAEHIAKLKLGAGVKVKMTKCNNIQFHRKMFALLGVAFDAWESPELEYKGERVSKNIEQFREDITILAGFYTFAVRLDGSVRFNAKSWSFEKMDDVEKEALYNKIIDVVLAKILTKYTRSDLDEVVERVLRFDK